MVEQGEPRNQRDQWDDTLRASMPVQQWTIHSLLRIQCDDELSYR